MELPRTHEIQAIHIEGMEDRDKCYIPLWHNADETEIKGHDSACPSAFTRIGAGMLGYVGDFPLQPETIRLMKCMIGNVSI